MCCFSSCGSSSRVDILVCTPGRLVDHISSTANFTLHHVRFLVIDEADRLLDQSYHGWLGKVLKAAYHRQYASGVIKNDRFGIHYKPISQYVKSDRPFVTVFCDHLCSCSIRKRLFLVTYCTFQQGDQWEKINVNFQRVVKISVNKFLLNED